MANLFLFYSIVTPPSLARGMLEEKKILYNSWWNKGLDKLERDSKKVKD